MKFRIRIERPGDIDAGMLDAALRDSIPRIVRLVEGYARANLGGGLVRVRTGKTLAGLRSSSNVSGSNPRGEVGVGGRRGHIARLLETGAAPHQIVGKNGGLLIFRAGAEIITKRMVRHPGFAGRHWLTLAGEKALPEAERDLQRSVDNVLTAVVKRRVTTTRE
jgi:hypothetical protein